MSLLIKGAEMPKNCAECRYSCKHYDCPLVEVPSNVELIDKQTAIDIAPKLTIALDGYEMYNQAITNYCVEITQLTPAQPQRTGKWNDCDPICPVCGEDKFKDLDADIWADWKPKFCPNCGAKMEG